jgi:REP element-mobilizing transposase RayT
MRSNNGTEVPAPNNFFNGTTPKGIHFDKVPAPEEEEQNGVGVLTPSTGVETLVSSDSDDGTEVPTPRGKQYGTEVPTPKIAKRFLPHIDLIGYYQFVTFRTHDSLDEFIKKIRSEEISSRKQEYKIDQYIDQSSKGAYLNNEVLKYLYRYFVEQDQSLYDLVAFTIMPNHVHILFKQNIELPQIMQRIKGATAFAINKILDRKGIFWEENYYDKVIRDEAHFAQVYDYIKYNAYKANIKNAKERFYGIYE